ncbi:hypothetical protein [Lentzea sp. CA-135723]|uniref:hypothetical protein n=1 Tax=Lentzea sp. CA-135723 TaxID=3239950 RepID=UPI003D8F657D
MKWFRWRWAAREACSFCGALKPETALGPVAGPVGTPPALGCAGCWAGFVEFERTVRLQSIERRNRWVLPVPRTEYRIVPAADPLDEVRAALAPLASRLRRVPAPTARVAAFTLEIDGPARREPIAATSHAEAVDGIARDIADHLAEYRAITLHLADGKRPKYSIFSAALFGAASGVLFQQLMNDGSRFQQTCYLVDTGFTVHQYRPYLRSPFTDDGPPPAGRRRAGG